MKKFFIFLFVISFLIAGEKPEKYWIVFKDKGIYENVSLAKGGVLYNRLKSSISERSYERRLKTVRDETKVFDYYDLPVYDGYIDKIKSLGVKINVVSKWLNAVSAYLDSSQIEIVKNLPFVLEVKPVAKSVNTFFDKPEVETPLIDYNYGASERQIRLSGVKELHKMNIIGKDVIVGMMDTGFRLSHESLENVEVIAQYDFIFNDTITANQPVDSPDQDSHGTLTLSVLGGKKDGQIYGVAPGAKFVLAKTEDVRSETPAEEDNWVRAIEWMDSLGVDVVSSSLGYIDWYTYENMDGNTAKITKAADIAFQKGIVVVNSAGNERNTSWKYVVAPADGKYVIAVGAVDSLGRIAYFSSMGPTYDGRIKPDVCALGVSVYGASTSSKSSYRYASGTSLSCPIVAGIAALILSVHPELSSFDVRDAIRNTASRADNPDNDYGWGIVNGLSACLYHGPILSNYPEIRESLNGYEISVYAMSKNGIKEVFIMADALRFPMQNVGGNKYTTTLTTLPSNFLIIAVDNKDERNFLTVHLDIQPPREFRLSQNFPNPFNSKTIFLLDVPEPTSVSLSIYNILGQKVRTLENRFFSQPVKDYRIVWDGKDDYGRYVPSGVYFCKLETPVYKTIRKVVLIR
ncbi:S8 family serine peptidase [Candidatus Chrysopegis kryptomonas]|uniref:Por secretion system C-terminal sorting domain-containing protein n=1 Tax=Candidatus Chryseopegocella kryptomonas TaxID=1633643 RepID=A0A0P1MKJ3_9BACT|nr:S8 family serine peptidase [Candidatus Chrysopegis kryptomonas]CUS95909.1 Por secretion system C-terminal sorting domain-containing protein [Candidatus Chrysopegis kryptomonas]